MAVVACVRLDLHGKVVFPSLWNSNSTLFFQGLEHMQKKRRVFEAICVDYYLVSKQNHLRPFYNTDQYLWSLLRAIHARRAAVQMGKQ